MDLDRRYQTERMDIETEVRNSEVKEAGEIVEIRTGKSLHVDGVEIISEEYYDATVVKISCF